MARVAGNNRITLKICNTGTSILVLLFCLFTTADLIAGSSNNQDVNRLNITAKETPLSEIFEKVYHQTGYKVFISRQWQDLRVTGEYKDVELDHLLSRIFKGRNVSVITDLNSKSYYVRMFGDKEPFYQSGLYKNRHPQKKEISDITKQLAKQKRKFKEYLNSADAIDPLSGMSLADIKKLHESQKVKISQIKKSKKYKDELASTKEQRAKIENYISSGLAKDPISQMSMPEIEEQISRQRKEIDEMLSDPNTVIDKETGMTMQELKDWQHKQLHSALGGQ